MGNVQLDQVNVVVGDVAGATGFLVALGLDVPPAMDIWRHHHQQIPTSTSGDTGHDAGEPGFGVDLDSSVFASDWGGIDPSFTGVVVNLRVDDRQEVDRLHTVALAVGGASLKAPYDAFWGSRYAVVHGPGPLVVGLMSSSDPAQRHPPPDPASLA